MALFDYSGVKSFSATLEVEDPGTCAIVAHGYYSVGKGLKIPADYYMIIKTVMGQSTVLSWGPVDGCPELPGGFDLSVKSFRYKEAGVNREINMFLNDSMHFIYEAAAIEIEAAFENLPQNYNFAATLEYTINDEKTGDA